MSSQSQLSEPISLNFLINCHLGALHEAKIPAGNLKTAVPIRRGPRGTTLKNAHSSQKKKRERNKMSYLKYIQLSKNVAAFNIQKAGFGYFGFLWS